MSTKHVCIVLTASIVLLTGCGRSIAPRGWPQRPDALQEDVYGSWVRVTHWRGVSNEARIAGELIAISADSIHVLEATGLTALPLSAVAQIKVQKHPVQSFNAAGIVALGFVSTLSHGFFLVISAPAWLLFGLISSHEVAYLSQTTVTDIAGLQEVAMWARYPRGLPANVPRSQLTWKSRREIESRIPQKHLWR